MRREIIVLQEKNDEDMNAITYTDLLQTGAEALSSDADEDEVGGVELGEGDFEGPHLLHARRGGSGGAHR